MKVTEKRSKEKKNWINSVIEYDRDVDGNRSL